jgi:repressor LexA
LSEALVELGQLLVGRLVEQPHHERVADVSQRVEVHIETTDLLPYREGDFFLRVRGDSMMGDGILDGDWVLLRPNLEVQHGEIAALLVGEAHETTLKRVLFVPEKSEIILRASNPRYPDLVVNAQDVRVAGTFRVNSHANS